MYDQRPDYLKELPPPTDEGRWAGMLDTFEELREYVEIFRVETREEALARSLAWDDPDAGVQVRPWLLIPYRRTFAGADGQQAFLKDHINRARELIPTLEAMFAKRQPDAEFLEAWGAFCESAAVAKTIYFSEHDDLGPDRAGLKSAEATGLERHRQWFAHYYLRERANYPDRLSTEDAIERLINAIVEGNVNPGDRVPIYWFKKFLSTNGESRPYPLTNAFREKKLSQRSMQALVRLPPDDLPPLDLAIPTP